MYDTVQTHERLVACKIFIERAVVGCVQLT